jgi:hypothetical protein
MAGRNLPSFPVQEAAPSFALVLKPWGRSLEQVSEVVNPLLFTTLPDSVLAGTLGKWILYRVTADGRIRPPKPETIFAEQNGAFSRPIRLMYRLLLHVVEFGFP